jgi:hypothetical protein
MVHNANFGRSSALRAAMGLVAIAIAATSRAPKTLRLLRAVMCMQSLATTVLFGPVRARAILEWETMHGTAGLRRSRCGGAFPVVRHRRRSS